MWQIEILLSYVILHKESQTQTLRQGLVRTRDTTGSKLSVPVLARENQHETSLSNFFDVECTTMWEPEKIGAGITDVKM